MSLKDYLNEKAKEVSSTAAAMTRQGAKDLHNAIIPAFADSAKSIDEPGLPNSITSQEVNVQKGNMDFQKSEPEMEHD